MTRFMALVCAAAVALALGAGLAGSASSGRGGSKDPVGDVSVRDLGLSQDQKDAVDLVSMRVTGAKGLGVFVKATFKGEPAKELGRGKLETAGVALVLRPKSAKAGTAGVVSFGKGKAGRLYRHTSSKTVGAFRHGHTVSFWILGPGYESVKGLALETVAHARGAITGHAAADDPPYVGKRLWDRFIALHPIDLHVMVGDPSALSCSELKDLLASIDADLDDPYFSQNVSFAVTKALHAFRSTVKQLLSECDLHSSFTWHRFSAKEVAGSGRIIGPRQRFTSVNVVLPEKFSIGNHLCPTQLPHGFVNHNSIVCSGGSLQTGTAFTLNLQTSPFPPNDLGGKLYVTLTDGTRFGPFTIPGP